MKSHLRTQVFLAMLLAMPGCAGIGVVETSDPAIKLSDAEHLFSKADRPLIAERLIREAIEIYEKNGDQLGLAEAYREYGFYFRAPSIKGTWSQYYRENGFLDKSATFDTRYTKSIEYFEKAADIFAAINHFDELTNVKLNVGFTYIIMGNPAAGCQAFDRALDSYHENIHQNPTAKPAVPQGFESFEDFTLHIKKHNGCS